MFVRQKSAFADIEPVQINYRHRTMEINALLSFNPYLWILPSRQIT